MLAKSCTLQIRLHLSKEDNTLYSPDQIKLALRDRKITKIAKATGLAIQTVRDAAQGTRRPSYDTVVTLSQYIDSGGGIDKSRKDEP